MTRTIVVKLSELPGTRARTAVFPGCLRLESEFWARRTGWIGRPATMTAAIRSFTPEIYAVAFCSVAKIIRPAPVWRSRVIVTGASVPTSDLPAIDHHHGAIVEESDALAGLPPFLDELQRDLLTRIDDRAKGVREHVQVQDLDSLHLRHLARG